MKTILIQSYLLVKSKKNLLVKAGGARGVMVIVAGYGYGHGDTSSNPGRD